MAPQIINSLLSIENIKKDTLKYIHDNYITRIEMSFRIGCHHTNLTKFLNTSMGFNSNNLINLLNLLYHENEKC